MRKPKKIISKKKVITAIKENGKVVIKKQPN